MPILIEVFQNKAPTVKRHCVEYMGDIMSLFGREMCDKYAKKIQESIKNLLTGGDSTGRVSARRVFYQFKPLYPKMASEIENSLDSQSRKHLLEADTNKNFGSTTKLDQIDSASQVASSRVNSGTLKRPPSAKPVGETRKSIIFFEFRVLLLV
jgi:hypothetical protein